MKLIPLKEVLNEMELGLPFSIVYYSYDKRRGKAGERIELKGASCAVRRAKSESEGESAPSTGSGSATRNPNHWQNATRNVVLPNGETRKLHIRLITRFNNQKVHW